MTISWHQCWPPPSDAAILTGGGGLCTHNPKLPSVADHRRRRSKAILFWLGNSKSFIARKPSDSATAFFFWAKSRLGDDLIDLIMLFLWWPRWSNFDVIVW